MNQQEHLEVIFFAALEIEVPTQQAEYVREACHGDLRLQAQVEKMLQAHRRAGAFLKQPLIEQLAAAVDQTHDLDPGRNAPPSTNATEENTITSDGPVPSLLGVSEEGTFPYLQPPTRPNSLGRIGHYEVLQVLGKGGFGIVFRAFDDVLERIVAVKVMAPQMAITSPARKRFLREARSSAQVRHENIVQVYAVEEQPLPYLVMEFIPGETLQQRLNRMGPFEPSDVVRIGRQIAEGLAAAHAMDLIHRDIKPGNVLLEGGQLRVKITDFGLARAVDDASLSQSGAIAGTPMYMAPEQALGLPLDQRADLFSLGSVLYTMVTGRPPFRANSMLAVLKRVAEEQPRAIHEIIPEAPEWLIAIIRKLHAKDPKDRYRSAREVADVFAHCESLLQANPQALQQRPKPVSPSRVRGKVLLVAMLLPLAIFGVWTLVYSSWLHTPHENKSTPEYQTPNPPMLGKALPEDVLQIATLKGHQQVDALRAALMNRNPDFDGKLIATIERDIVVALELNAEGVTDIAPLSAFKGLKVLTCPSAAGRPKSKLADITPLRGLPLTTLHLSSTSVTDIRPLQDMPLTHLYIDNTPVEDLRPLKGMKLQELNCSYTAVATVAPLRGMPLNTLWCNHTLIDDLSPLAGMPLQWITFHGTKVTDIRPLKTMRLQNVYLDYVHTRDRPIIWSLPLLSRINDQPIGDFKRVWEQP